MAKNIIDIPIGGTGISKDDQLELDKYISGLSEFIAYSDMPTTIAIQGEWGSGKTSMMNLLKDRLCRKLVKVEEDDPTEQRPYYGIWINVWKYSLLKTPEMTLLTVLSAMTEQIIEHMNYRHADKLHKIISGIGNKVTKFLTVGTSIGLNYLSNTKLGIGSVVSNPFLPLLSQLNPSKDDGNQQTQSPEEIQNSLNKAIENFIEAESQTSKAKQTHPARGFLFFIDDLDRMEPSVAVSLLELLKNIFEVNNCVFVIAIDYDVVVRGLRSKFGDQKISADNERQYRSFFDKIIQLPFNMPLYNYNIKKFLLQGLNSIGYFKESRFKKFSDSVVIDKLKSLVENSCGHNPRSIIRVINNLSLINIMQNQSTVYTKTSDEDEILNFGLICMQIAYPRIYRLLQKKPSFNIQWEEEFDEIVREFDLNIQSENDQSFADGSIEKKVFADDDDDISNASNGKRASWDHLIDVVCSDDVYLKRHRADISNMLSIFYSLFSDDVENIGLHVKSVINISAVTSVSDSKTTLKSEDPDSDTINLNSVSDNVKDPVEKFCQLIKESNKAYKDQKQIEKTVKLYKEFFADLKNRYKDLIFIDCKASIQVKVSEKISKATNIGYTYSYDYIRPGKFSFGITGSSIKSYSSLDEVQNDFYEDFNEAFNKISKVKVKIIKGKYVIIDSDYISDSTNSVSQISTYGFDHNQNLESGNTTIKRVSFDDDLSNVVSVTEFEFQNKSYLTTTFSSVLTTVINCLHEINPAKLNSLADRGFKMSNDKRSSRFYIYKSDEGMVNSHLFFNKIYVEFNMNKSNMLHFIQNLLNEFNIDKATVFLKAEINEI